MNLPWYVKSFYNAEKRCYILKVNKWWAFWRYIQIHFVMRWINKNTYLFSWNEMRNDIEIPDTLSCWNVPNHDDLEKITNYSTTTNTNKS